MPEVQKEVNVPEEELEEELEDELDDEEDVAVHMKKTVLQID